MADGLPLVSAASRPAAPRWPYAGAGQKTLLAGALLIAFGSFLPWVSTPFGNLSGMAGPGLWTFSLGVAGVAGSLLHRRRIALAHALVAGSCAVALTAWQVVHLLLISGRTAAWGAVVPSTGLLLVLGGGVLALRAAWRLHSE